MSGKVVDLIVINGVYDCEDDYEFIPATNEWRNRYDGHNETDIDWYLRKTKGPELKVEKEVRKIVLRRNI